MKVEVDQDTCIGSGQCVLTAPEVFDQRDEDGIVELLVEVPDQARERNVRDAAAGCPAAAITVVED